ncbi:MAG: DUF2281 domain-containing protein [Chloroflexi bacterium]|nr:DUF2281 domain-containing protein [Chloroflexota bacterium]MCC6895961.1 DUF2281 domain-containing protein [Anaerolineae bacterium]
MLTIPIKFDDLLKVVDTLSPEQKQLLRQHIDNEPNSSEIDLSKPRVLGLHMGSMWMSDDFDDPLPDEFWLGEDA